MRAPGTREIEEDVGVRIGAPNAVGNGDENRLRQRLAGREGLAAARIYETALDKGARVGAFAIGQGDGVGAGGQAVTAAPGADVTFICIGVPVRLGYGRLVDA